MIFIYNTPHRCLCWISALISLASGSLFWKFFEFTVLQVFAGDRSHAAGTFLVKDNFYES